MNEVRRYNMESNDKGEHWMKSAENGDFVEYPDYEEDVKELKEALQDLYDEQNGPPLIRDKDKWQAAMDKAEQALGEQQ